MKKFDKMFGRFDTVHECDKQTDTMAILYAMAFVYVCSCGKNS